MTEDEPSPSRSHAIASGARYLLTLSRPRFWLYLAGPVLVGLAYAATMPADLVDPVPVAFVAYFLVPANVYLYGVNDVFDRDVDAANPKKSGREARFSGDRWVVGVVALAGALLVPVAAVTPAIAWPYLGAYAILATEYSAPPLRFKTTPFLDSASNGLYVLPGAAAYAAVAGAHPPVAAFAGAWLWTMAMHTFSAIPDIDPDREAGIRTTATALGERRTYGYCIACWTGAAAAFALVDVRLGALLAVYPVFTLGVARSSVAVDRAYWWFPILNTIVGAVLTAGGLWRLANV
jgi:4-hydroxybenzoate polyprenyltransferase